MYLVDTNVVSELRRGRPHGAVLAWLRSVDDGDLHIAAVTLGEIQAGIELTRERDPLNALEIEAWLDAISATYNILPMDGVTFRCWSRLVHRRPAGLIEDAMIAATAQVHDLTIVTRNVRDFAHFHSKVLNPFEFC
jgi:predicted nucleic acid-binding protein